MPSWRILCLKTRICNQGLNLVMFGETGKTKTVYSRFDYCSKELFFWTLECMEEVGYYGMYAFYCYNIGPLNPYTQSKSVINGVINWTLNSDTIFDLYMGLYFCLMKLLPPYSLPLQGNVKVEKIKIKFLIFFFVFFANTSK